MKVAITGAGGRLGSQTVRELVEAGFDVVGTDRRDNPHLPVKLHVLDLLDPPAVSGVVKGAQAVVHLANHAGPHNRLQAQTFNENVAMDMNVFQAALETGARKVIFASFIQAMASEWVDSQPDQQPHKVAYLPMDGDSPAHPTNTYALSKAVGEAMLRDFVARPGMDCVALRFPMLTGLDHLRRWHRRPQSPLGQASPVWIGQGFGYLTFADAARLIHAILKSSLPGFRIYLPALSFSDGPILPEYVKAYYAGVPLRKPLEQMTSLIDISRIARDTGWSPQDRTEPRP